MSEWFSISTAPKDGTFIIIAGNSGYYSTPLRVSVARYYKPYNVDGLWMTHSGDNFTDGGESPTHWMPLPPPPQTSGDTHD